MRGLIQHLSRASPLPSGIRFIVGYKFVRLATMVPLALVVTFAPGSTFRLAASGVRQFAEFGEASAQVAHWLQSQFSREDMLSVAILAWTDAALSAIEAILLLIGKAWALWLVVAGSTLLLPLELRSVWREAGVANSLLLLTNLVIVGYLIQIRRRRDGHISLGRT